MKKLISLLTVFLLLTSFGCGKKETEKQPTVPGPDKKLFALGASEIKPIQTDKAVRDNMQLEQQGKAYSFELFENKKISIETNFKGEAVLLSPQGEELKKFSAKNKYYIPAKDGKYYVWLKNNAVPTDYYITVKTFNKGQFFKDSDNIPGTKVDQDGLIKGVVDSKTDKEDYYYFSVLSDYDVRIFQNNPEVDVVIMNKYKEETPVVKNRETEIFIMTAQQLYVKVTAKAGKVGIPYEINIKRIKNKL